ncbi:MAG: helix-turn-helix domain-containing protein [Caldilineaceae bacterium]
MEAMTFGRWVKRLRAEQDLTQEMLSELVNCSPVTLRSFEIGKRRPSRELAERIADVLAVPPAEREEFLRLARLPVEGQGATPATPEPNGQRAPNPTPTFHATLPPVIGPMIGREAEQNALCTLLLDDSNRLVTLTGAGGMGKTRLALAVATILTPQFTDGVLFVPMAPLGAAALLPEAIAGALQLPPGSSDPSQQVLTALATRHLLLVLDGFEELLHPQAAGEQDAGQDASQDAGDDSSAATWIKLLVQHTTRLQLLITSRERLRLSRERSFELDGLSLPTAAAPPTMSDAVLLFLERAQQAAPDFRLERSNEKAIARICHLVDGIPLAIELAAAWVNVLSPQEIATELESNIDFLTRANRDTPPRHRSMRAVFDHSWALLNQAERATLGLLAAFRGGCNREAAQVVAKASLPLLAGLIDKSLVRRRQAESQARYELHEVVRQFATEKRQSIVTGPNPAGPMLRGLEQDTIWLAHYTYFYKLVATARSHLYGRDQLQWLAILDEEHANVRAALDRSLGAQDFARGLQLAIQLEEYWYVRGHHREGLQRLLAFLHHEATLPAGEVARGFVAAAILAIADGNYPAARTYIERCVAPIRQSGDRATLARLLRYWGLIALHEADYVAAEALANEAIELAIALNNHYEWATTLSHLAEIALIHQNYSRAQTLGEQAVQMLRRVEDKNQLAGALRRLAQARIQQGQWEKARHEALESLALNNEVRDQRGTAASIVMLTTLVAAREEWPAVAQLLGAATYLLARTQASLLPADQLVYEELRQHALSRLPNFHALYEAGQVRMAQEQNPPYHLDWVYRLLA